MNYFQYLRKKFPVYIISGVVVSLAVFMAVSTHRYDNYLFNVQDDLQTIVQNKNKIQDKVEEIDSLLSYFKSTFQIDIADVKSERLILSALDKLKDHMPGASITATKFNRNEGTMMLPVEIQLTIESYHMLVTTVEYITSFRIPDYRIKKLHIAEGSPGELVLLVNGDLSMPDFNEEQSYEQ
jgi:hypothetical protein